MTHDKEITSIPCRSTNFVVFAVDSEWITQTHTQAKIKMVRSKDSCWTDDFIETWLLFSTEAAAQASDHIKRHYDPSIHRRQLLKCKKCWFQLKFSLINIHWFNSYAKLVATKRCTNRWELLIDNCVLTRFLFFRFSYLWPDMNYMAGYSVVADWTP